MPGRDAAHLSHNGQRTTRAGRAAGRTPRRTPIAGGPLLGIGGGASPRVVRVVTLTGIARVRSVCSEGAERSA